MPAAKIEKLFPGEQRHAQQLRLIHPPEMIDHYINVARILRRHHADEPTIMAAMYHGFPHADKREEIFGRNLQRGFKELSRRTGLSPSSITLINHYNNVPVLTASMRLTPATLEKLYYRASLDPRIFLMAAADKLEQMQNPRVPIDAKKGMAKMVFGVYAPDAHRANLYSLARELEEEALHILYPELYKKINTLIDRRIGHRFKLERMELENILKDAGVPFLSVAARERKGAYSTLSRIFRADKTFHYKNWGKLSPQQIAKGIRELHDLAGFRVITPDGYNEEGKPYFDLAREAIQQHFGADAKLDKDYINQPKPNQYQSYHFLIGPLNRKRMPIEIQIRNETMHNTAEYGNAAHWGHKGHGAVDLFRRLSEYYSRLPDLDRARRKGFDRWIQKTVSPEPEEGRVPITIGNRTHYFPKHATWLDVITRLHPGQFPFLKTTYVDGKAVKLDGSVSPTKNVRIRFSQAPTITLFWQKYVKTPEGQRLMQEAIRRHVSGIKIPKDKRKFRRK